MGAVVFAIAIPEIFSVFSFNSPFGGEPWTVRSDHEAGNLGFDPAGLKPTKEGDLLAMQNAELNNGRLAMIAAAGMIFQEAFVTHAKLFWLERGPVPLWPMERCVNSLVRSFAATRGAL